MNEDNSQSTIMQSLNFLYDKAVNGSFPFMPSVKELAESYLKKGKYKTMQERASSFINWQVAKTSTSGFITGLGGIITLPIAIPADVGIVLLVQMRMIAVIAYMGGYNLKDDQVKTMVYMTLAGMSVGDITKRTLIGIGVKIGEKVLTKLPGKILIDINKQVGFRLFTKFGSKGIINIIKVVPVIGGLIGGAVDGGVTKIIGNMAIKNFIDIDDTK
ncbi:MAG: EcsC family protein [bacterium]